MIMAKVVLFGPDTPLVQINIRTGGNAVPRTVTKITPPARVTNDPKKPNGELILQTPEKADWANLLRDLQDAGYKAITVSCREVPKSRGMENVRFTFVHEDHFEPAADKRERGVQQENAAEARIALKHMCGDVSEDWEVALWKGQIHKNSWWRDGVAVEGKSAVIIGLAAREPLYDEEGNPLLRRQKDEDGQKIIDDPTKPKIPIQASGEVHILEDGELMFIVA